MKCIGRREKRYLYSNEYKWKHDTGVRIIFPAEKRYSYSTHNYNLYSSGSWPNTAENNLFFRLYNHKSGSWQRIIFAQSWRTRPRRLKTPIVLQVVPVRQPHQTKAVETWAVQIYGQWVPWECKSCLCGSHRTQADIADISSADISSSVVKCSAEIKF
jgi:hypothetical protein